MGFQPAGVKEFIKLDDTPDTYAGQGGKFTRVKGAEDGLEMATAMTGVTVRKNTQMPVVGARPQLNFMEGAAIDIAIADNPSDNEIDIAISTKYPTRFMPLIPDDAVLPTTNPPTLSKVDGTNFSYDVLDFDQSTEKKCYWGWWLTPDYQAEDIIIDIFWTATPASGDVKWGVQVLGRSEGEAYDFALGTEQVVVSPTGGAGVLNQARIPVFSPNWAGQDVLQIKLARKAADAVDTLAADARVNKVVVRYTGQFAQSFYPLPSAVDISPSAGSWQTVGVQVPIGATGVILHIYNTGIGQAYGLRKKGSTDARIQQIDGGCHTWAMIGIDENRELEIYISSAVHCLLVGYTASGVVFFDNAYNRNPTVVGVWEAVDLSDILPSDAIGVILEATTSGSNIGMGCRKTGSAFDIWGSMRYHDWMICGVNGSQQVDLKMADLANNNFYVVGYITGGAVFPTTPPAKTISQAGAYEDVDCQTQAPSAVMIFFLYMGGSGKDYAVRKNGDTEDIYYETLFALGWAFVPCDANQIVEAKIANISYDNLYIYGYAKWAGA